MFKKRFGAFIAFVLVFALASSAATFYASYTARTITIHQIDGTNATVQRGARSIDGRVGHRVTEGSTLITGARTTMNLLIDGETVLQMSENSEVNIGQARSRLSLTVLSGAALFDVSAQAPGNSVETRIGNTGLTVRGTMFTMNRTNGHIAVHMLSGYGDIDGQTLVAGQSFTSIDGVVSIADLDVAALDSFTLESIIANADYLVNAGSFTLEDIELVTQTAHTQAQPPVAYNEPAQDNVDTYVPELPPSTTPPAGDNGNNGGQDDDDDLTGGNDDDDDDDDYVQLRTVRINLTSPGYLLGNWTINGESESATVPVGSTVYITIDHQILAHRFVGWFEFGTIPDLLYFSNRFVGPSRTTSFIMPDRDLNLVAYFVPGFEQ